jgi:hypothetical protein
MFSGQFSTRVPTSRRRSSRVEVYGSREDAPRSRARSRDRPDIAGLASGGGDGEAMVRDPAKGLLGVVDASRHVSFVAGAPINSRRSTLTTLAALLYLGFSSLLSGGEEPTAGARARFTSPRAQWTAHRCGSARDYVGLSAVEEGGRCRRCRRCPATSLWFERMHRDPSLESP